MSLTARPTPAGRMGRDDKGISAPWGYSAAYRDGDVFHHGQDYYWLADDVAGSRKVYAAGTGKVVKVAYDSMMGLCITIDHGTFETRSCHMPKGAAAVKVDQEVTTSTYLGPMGNAGTAAGGQYHLHFEVWVDGVRVDPAPYFTSAAGGGTRITEESETTMSDGISYLYKPKGTTPVAYGVFGAEIPGGSYVTSSVAEAEALGAMYGTRALDSAGQEVRVGAPWKAMTEAQWPVLIATAKKLADAREAQAVRILVAAGKGTTPASGPTAAEIAKAVNDDAANRLAQ